MGHLTYTESKSLATKTIVILAVITIGEVLIALLGKGYIIEGLHFPHIIMGGLMIILSLVKAYLIIFEFMHMKYESKGLVRSVLFPTVLLIWAVIAFLWEGDYWKSQREIMTTGHVEAPAVDHDAHQGDVHHADDSHGGH